jgi:hypothetical protein
MSVSPSPYRVASVKVASQESNTLFDSFQSRLSALREMVAQSENRSATLTRLIGMGESRRLARAKDVAVGSYALGHNSASVSADTTTGGRVYQTRITFQPRTGFRCTCPDVQNRRVPCKHVLALAMSANTQVGDNRIFLLEDVRKAKAELP